MWSSFFFFFSSRRRHTRFDCDWSSDVCSSDLPLAAGFGSGLRVRRHEVVVDTLQRSEEHTSELQSQSNLVCRLLLEKKKKKRQRLSRSSNTWRCHRAAAEGRCAHARGGLIRCD